MRRPRSHTPKKRRGKLFLLFERVVLGAGMSIVAFFIERRLIKAIKKGGVEGRPAAEPADPDRKVEVTRGPNGEGWANR